MTELQIITAVMNLVTSSEGVTNTSLSPEQVAEEMDTLRVRMIDEIDKVSLFRRPYIGYTQMIDSIPVLTNATTKRKYIDIPRLVIKRDSTPAYLYIGGTDNKSPFRVITGENADNATHDHFISTFPIALYNEGHIDFYNSVPNQIKLIAVWEDPSALESLGVYDTEVNPYPMPIGLIDQLIGKTADGYIRTMYRISVQANTQSDKPTGPQNARR